MNILMVLRAPTGGLWRHAVDLAEILAKQGRNVGLAMDGSFSDAQTERGVARLEPLLTLGIHRLPIARQPGLTDALAGLKIRRLARRLGADVVHGHGAKGGVYARMAAFGVRDRVAIYTPHGGVLNFKVGQRSGDLLRSAERMMLGMNDAIAFESEYARTAYSEIIGAPNCVSDVVHNGLGPDDFEPLPEADEQFDFAFIGELRALKGVPILLEALSDTTRSDGTPATLILAGGGRDEASIRQLADTLGLQDRVRFVGVRPAREVFARSSCVVMPSFHESLPYVVLEAAASGRQVIATNVGGIKEIFGPYADRLVPARDVGSLKSAMGRFLADADRAREEARELHEYVAEHFNISRMAAGIEALYGKALAMQRR